MLNKVYGVFEMVDYSNPDLIKLFYVENEANKHCEFLKSINSYWADLYYVQELIIE